MKSKIKKILIKLLHPFIIKLGYIRKGDLNNVSNKESLLGRCCTNLKKMGFNAKHIVDIGANRGAWTREMLNHFPNAYYSLFEPQDRLHMFLEDLTLNPKIASYKVGVSNKTDSLKFTIVDRDDSCSFRYSEEEARIAGFRQVEVPVVTLNDFFKDSKKPIPDLIKIDAEGLDLEVLEGASDFIGKAEVVLVEAAVACKFFKNDIQRMINTMANYGYKVFDITDLNRPFNPSVLWLVELVFVKKGGSVDNYKHNTN